MSGLSPRPHQVAALADLMRAFAVHDRVQLVMACGTGKTLVGRWHAEASEARRVLVLVPSLALLAQTLREWRRSRRWAFEALVVCSDPTTSVGAAERAGDSPDVDDLTEIPRPAWADVRARVTTDPAERARRLEEIPGWYWDRAEALWSDTYAVLAVLADELGDLTEPASGPSILHGMHAAGSPRRRLGVWVAAQRQAYRAGTLSASKAAALESLPEWTWTPVPAQDLAMVDALAQFVEFEKHADPAADVVEDGLPLGRWVWAVRRRKLTGVLHPALEDEIWAATPSKWGYAGRRWLWRTSEAQWRMGYTALRHYLAREGHASPPTSHVEQLPDTAVHLGQWVAVQRHQRRGGRLDPQYDQRLAALPGWRWDGDVGGTRPPGEPLQLPPHLTHGTAGAVARAAVPAKPAWTAAGPSNGTGWPAAARSSAVAPPAPARRHIVALEAAGITRGLIAAGSGVPIGVIRQLAAGTAQQVTIEHDMALRATTAQMCRSHQNRAGSPGRAASAGGERVDAAPTWRHVDELARRGFNLGWIGRELGYQRSLQLDQHVITRRIAAQVDDLVRRVGVLRMPALPRNQPHPTLAELQQQTTRRAG